MTRSALASLRFRGPGRALTHTLAVTPVAALSLACLVPVDGDRATTGDCPMGETCSQATPSGLTFVGRALFDQGETPRLGPIVEGGTLEVGLLGLIPIDREVPIAHEARVDEPGVLSVVAGTGEFGPLDEEGRSLYPVESHVVVTGLAVGGGHLRMVDPATGELYDRTPVDVVGIDDVTVVSATDLDRSHLYAGCDEMVGVRLLSGQDAIEVRAIDDSMTVRVAGVLVEPEPAFWDCVVVTVPETPGDLAFEIHAGGRDFVRTMEVRSLDDDGLSACPARAD